MKDFSSDQSIKVLDKDGLTLPNLSGMIDSSSNKEKLSAIDGTNVVRVPFGVRQPRRQRPNIPDRLATLVLPFQRSDFPTPPPHAA